MQPFKRHRDLTKEVIDLLIETAKDDDHTKRMSSTIDVYEFLLPMIIYYEERRHRVFVGIVMMLISFWIGMLFGNTEIVQW